MSSKKILFTVLLIVCLIASTAFGAFAYEENFIVSTQSEEINACSCGLTTNVVTVMNTGSITSSYLATISGSAKKFITLNEDVFILKPGEKKDLLEYVKISCGEKGEFDLKTTIETVLGNKKEVVQTFSVDNCPNVQILAKDSEQQTCPGSTPKFEFEIQNTGSFDDQYEIKMSPYSEYITLSENLVSIKAGESKTIYAFINMDNSFSGNIELEFSATAKNSQIQGKVPVTLIVNPCFDYIVGFDPEYTICRNIDYEFPLKIKNDADVSNAYKIEIESEDKLEWVGLQDDGLLVYDNDVSESKVLMQPKTTEAGQYEFTLKVMSERGNIEQYADAKVDLQDCYKVNLKPVLPELVSGEENTGYVTIKNLGTRNDTFYLYAEGADWITFATDEITLAPQESQDVEMKLNIPLEVPEKIDVRFMAISYNYNFSNDYEETTLKIIPQEEAYEIDILAEDQRVSYEPTSEIIALKHAGMINTQYTFSVEGPEWVSVEEDKLYLEAEVDSQITLNVSPSNYTEEGTYPITIYATVDRVPDLSYARSFDIIVRNKGIFFIILPYLIFLIAAILIIYAIVLLVRKAKNRPKKPSMPDRPRRRKLALVDVYDPTLGPRPTGRARRFFKWLALIILILIILFALGFGGYKAYDHYTANQTMNTTATTTTADLATNALNMQTTTDGELPVFAVDTSYLSSWKNTIYLKRNEITSIPIQLHNPSGAPTKFTLKLFAENATWAELYSSEATVAPNETTSLYLDTTPDDFIESGDYPVTIEASYVMGGESITEQIDLNLNVGYYTTFFIAKIAVAALIGLILLAIVILIIKLISSRKRKEFKPKKEKKEKAPKPPKEGFWKRWKEKRKVAKERKRLREVKSKRFEAEKNIHVTNIGGIEPIFVKKHKKPRKGVKKFFKWLAVILLILIILGALFYGGKTVYDNSDSLKNWTTSWLKTNRTEQPVETAPVEEPVDETHTLKQPLFFVNRSELEGSGNVIEVEKFSVVDIPVTVKNPNNQPIEYKIKINENLDWIDVSKKTLKMDALESKPINITIFPGEEIETGDYELSIETQVSGVTESFTEKIDLRITEDEFKYLWAVLAGVVALIILVILIDLFRLYHRRRQHRKYFEEPKEAVKEVKQPKVKSTGKTKISLTKKKK